MIFKIMSTLKERVLEALSAAAKRGHDVAEIAKKCQVSVQSVYNWQNPELPIKWMRAKSVLGLSAMSGHSPWYIYDGVGEKILSYAKNEYQKKTLAVMEPMDIKDEAKMPGFGRTLAEPEDNGSSSERAAQ